VCVSQIGVVKVNTAEVNTAEVNTAEVNSCFLVLYSPGIPCLCSLLENVALFLICHDVPSSFPLLSIKTTAKR